MAYRLVVLLEAISTIVAVGGLVFLALDHGLTYR
jgi:hypothetical protein